MKNITLSAEDALIQKARQQASKENKSLNAVFREWLARYVGQASAAEDFKRLMKSAKNVSAGRKFSRDELNER